MNFNNDNFANYDTIITKSQSDKDYYNYRYLDVFWQEILMDDSSLLEVEHDICQLVGVLEHLVRSQTILRGRREKVGGGWGKGGDDANFV